VSEVSLPSFQVFMLPILKFLGGGGEKFVPHSPTQIREHIKTELHLTEAQIDKRLQSGVRRFSNNVSWALVHLNGAGFVISNEPKYFITPYGRAELEKNPAKIVLK